MINMKCLRHLLAAGFALVIAVACSTASDDTDDLVQAARQVTVPFVDQGSDDVSFQTARAVLAAASAARDVTAIKRITAPEVVLEPDSPSRRDVLLSYLTGPNAAQFWQALARSSAAGGVFIDEDRFVTTGFDDNWSDVDWDIAATYFAGPTPQPVFARPSLVAPVLTSLQNVGFEATRWSDGPFVEVRLTDGRLGYLRRADLLGIGDYRVTFERIDGRWLMTGFMPGL